MEPRVVINLVQMVIIVVGGVVGGYQRGAVSGQRITFGFGQEVVAVIRVRIACALQRLFLTPCNRTCSIEHTLAANGAGGYLFQVVGSREVIARQLFGLQCAAVAVDSYPTWIAEAGFLDECIR